MGKASPARNMRSHPHRIVIRQRPIVFRPQIVMLLQKKPLPAQAHAQPRLLASRQVRLRRGRDGEL
jgi:hypothetical protein